MTTASAPEPLDAEFLAQQRVLVEAEKKARSEVVEALAAEVQNHVRHRGVVSAEGFGTGETASVELERSRDRYAHALARLKEVAVALERLESGDYGQCECCGGPIGRDRLEAIPTTTRCIRCQSRR